MNLNVSSIAGLTASERATWLASLTTNAKAQLRYNWGFWSRDKQRIPDGDWNTWLILAGRGFGKTRTGAEAIRELVMERGYRRVALVARTAADARDVMVEGESGLLSVFPAWERPIYEPSKRRVVFSNGAIATTYSGDKPDQLRGPQHDVAWCDELAAWRYIESWDMLQFGLRLGEHPRAIITTTPRPIKVLRDMIKETGVIVTTGTTYENEANLAPAAAAHLYRKYEGTRLGRQELEAHILDDAPGALWKRDDLDRHRVGEAPALARVVVAIDPAATATEDSNETGIIVAGVGDNGHGYVLEDATLQGSPQEWARRAILMYEKYTADRIIAETNNGGDMVELTVRATARDMGRGTVAFRQVRASRGKHTRAEPVSALYEQGRVHHVGAFAELEDQYCIWTPGDDSPDRLDAAVWALTELMLSPSGEIVVEETNPFFN